MVLKQSFFKSFLFFLLLILSSILSAQEVCDCKAFSAKLKDQIVHDRNQVQLNKATEILKKSKFKSCVFEGLQMEFDFYISNRDSKNANRIIQKQLSLLKKMDCKGVYNYAIYANKSYYYRVVNDMENLSLYAFKSLKQAENDKDEANQILAIQDVVFMLTRMNEHNKKWNYILRAQKLIENQENNKQNSRNYLWLALEYETRFTRTKNKKLLDSMALFADKYIKVAFKFKIYDEVTNYYRIKEAYSYHKGNVKDALKNMDSAIFYGKKILGYKNLGPLYSAKAWDHLDNGQIAEANKSMDTAILLVKDIKDSSGQMMLFYDASNLYTGTGNIAKAFEVFKVYTKMKDSVWNMEKVEKVNELEQKYNKVKNEKMIFELEKTKQLYTFLILGGLFALLALIFFFRQRTLQNKQKIMETEQRLNRARINPHFFFNAMASLQNVSLQEKSTQTTLFISRFAKIMRKSLESTYEELVTVEDEIDFITQYLELQKLRFTEKFEYEFFVDKNMEINELQIPGMIIQPFIENAIEHGFKDIDYKGKIDVLFEEINDQLLITVKDNGKGQQVEKQEKKHKSRAMEIIKDRLYLFNKKYLSNASYRIVGKNSESGFSIVISLPKLYTT